MNVYVMLAAFAGCMTLAFIYARYAPQRRTTLPETMKRLSSAWRISAALIGTNLIPAMGEAVRAAEDFERTYNEQVALMKESRTA